MLDLGWPCKWHSEIFLGAQKYAQNSGWQTFIDERVDVLRSALPIKPSAYDGAISRATRKQALQAAHLNIPVVNVWRNSPVWNSLPGVFPDYSAIGRLRAEHLVSRGICRFTAITHENDLAHGLELEAFADRLAEGGYTCSSTKVPHIAFADKNLERFETLLAGCMDDWVLPIGVFIGSDLDGRLVAQMCLNRGWRVPEDVSIIAGHNMEMYCDGLRPTISSVEMDFERVGYEAAKLLDKLMNDGTSPAQPILLTPKGLVVRESTDAYSVSDAVISAALKFIANNFHKTIGQIDVARAVDTPLRTLQLRFHKHLGRTISSEICRARVERAKRELTQTDRTLKEIAWDVGFGEAMQMYKTFVREVGVKPSKYRQERLMNPIP
ncbi:MAG: substrate-binding domain-containing protein [Planctomycetota bacterium]